MTKALSCIHQENLSLTQTTEAISPMGRNDIIDLQFPQLHAFQHIFTQQAVTERKLSTYCKHL